MKRLLSLALAFVGVVLVGAAAAIYLTGLLDTAPTSSSAVADPVGTPSQNLVVGANGEDTPPTSTATESPEPIEDASELDVSAGPRIYTVADERSDVVIPGSITGAERANAEIWVDQQFITATCMAEQGYPYEFMMWWERGSDPKGLVRLNQSYGADEQLALWGDTGAGADYHWEDAGCVGYSVHVTGQDNNH